MSESQGNNILNQASSNMPVMGAAPSAGAAPTLPPSNNMPFTASPAEPQPVPQAAPAMPQVATAGSQAAMQPNATMAAEQPLAPQDAGAQASQPITPAPLATEQSSPVTPVMPSTNQPAAAAPTAGAQAAPANAAPNPATSPIGPADRQVDFFAEQNARAAEKKAKNKKTIKMILLIGGIILVLAVAGVVLWFTLKGDTKDTNTPAKVEENKSTSILEEARDLYSANGGANFSSNLDGSANEATEQFFADALDEAGGDETLTSEILLAQLLFYLNQGSGDCGTLLSYEDRIDANLLNASDRSTLYNVYGLCYQQAGNTEKYNYYSFQSYKLAMEIENAAYEEANHE